MDITISKTHSKTDLIELINTIDLPVVFGMSDNKRSIQHKLLKSLNEDIYYKPNVYKILTTQDLISYLTIKNPKRTLSVKEKKNIMKICKAIVIFCKCKYILQSQNYYKDLKQIDDDMLYISQFGDLPSVRRACKLMNENIMSKVKYEPLISPQIRKDLDEKLKLKRTNNFSCQFKKGPFVLLFD
tara:strand:+ start:163 stop:717 length:555 start_codon:yes stop_codon:yes gene_type:complete